MIKKNKKGSIVIIAVVVSSALFLIGGYLLSSNLSERKITRSVESSFQSYYLAESGINEVLWKLDNDNNWRESFINPDLNPDTDGNYWSASIYREIDDVGSYTATIKNTDIGYGEISVSSSVPFLERDAKRKVKITVFRGIDSPTNNAGMFSSGPSGNISIRHSHVIVTDGNLYVQNNLLLMNTTLSVFDNPETEILEGQIVVGSNINADQNTILADYTAMCEKNYCSEECTACPPPDLPMPIIDFDSNSPFSFKKRAEKIENDNNCEIYCQEEGGESYLCSQKCILTSDEFEDILWEVGENGTLMLRNNVTYILGYVDIKGARHLDVEGAMVVDGSIDIGVSNRWSRKGAQHTGNSHLSMNITEQRDFAGIIVKGKMDIGSYALQEEANLQGVLYSGNKMDITSLPYRMSIEGAILSRMISMTALYNELEIILNNKIMIKSLGYIVGNQIVVPHFSSALHLDHWEELY